MSDIPMLEVLLKRMETHPEEFGNSSRPHNWMRLIEHYSDCLSEEETNRINEALKKARRARFNEKIMKELAGEGEPTVPIEVPYTHPYTTNPTRPRMQSSSTSLPSEEELESMHKAFVKLGLERSREEQEELAKKHYTLEQIKTAIKKASS